MRGRVGIATLEPDIPVSLYSAMYPGRLDLSIFRLREIGNRSYVGRLGYLVI